MARPGKKYFIASVKDGYLSRINDVAEALKARGCDIRQVLSLTGTITGKVDNRVNLNDLQVDGIASIEKQRTMRKK